MGKTKKKKSGSAKKGKAKGKAKIGTKDTKEITQLKLKEVKTILKRCQAQFRDHKRKYSDIYKQGDVLERLIASSNKKKEMYEKKLE